MVVLEKIAAKKENIKLEEVKPETLFRHTKDFYKPADISAGQVHNSMRMDSHAKVTAGDTTLMLSAITYPIDAIQLTVTDSSNDDERDYVQTWEFSIDRVHDLTRSQEDSGHYSMSIDKHDSEIEGSMIIKEVQTFQGKNSAMIDIYYLNDKDTYKKQRDCDFMEDREHCLEVAEPTPNSGWLNRYKKREDTRIDPKDVGRISFIIKKGCNKVH